MDLSRPRWLCIWFLVAGCGPAQPVVEGSPKTVIPRRLFELDPKLAPTFDAGLLGRVRASPRGYFRFISEPFSNEVCRRLDVGLPAMGVVNLHGDAHLEQYAITDGGRGLTDFDEATMGPPALDLVRFGSSLVLTCGERGWAPDEAIAAFLRGYLEAIADPAKRAEEPRVVTRVRSAFRFDAQRYFTWLHSISEPLQTSHVGVVGDSLATYFDSALRSDASLGRDYFKIVEIRRTRIGIGSARARKYLVRVRGPTDSPDDDAVIELKEVGGKSGVTCAASGPPGDPLRIIVGQARMAYEPYRLVGVATIEGQSYWAHAWSNNYRELEPSLFETPSELTEVAFDVGVQLGLGHPKQIAAPYDQVLRDAILRGLRGHESEIVALSKELARDVTSAWQRFEESTRRVDSDDRSGGRR